MRLVEAHAAAGVAVLAVSDHNRVDWYPALRAAGDAVGVYVFPALEFSVNRCHLLAVWDRTDEGYALAQQFVTTLWKPGEKPFEPNGDPRPVGHGQVLELAQRAADHKAIVLAPHASAKDIGLFAKGVCTNRREVIHSGLIAGFDVWGNRAADVLSNPATDFGNLTPVWFMSGDVRTFTEVGKRAVYLKLGDVPTLEGLRQAFLMPETRIRFPEALRGQWGHVAGARFTASVQPSWPRLRDVKIDGGFHDLLALPFGPGLNAIIGGKGTGKSTLIEILRYVLHAGDPTTQDARGNREHNFRANAEAVVTFIDGAGDAYEVRRSGSHDPARLLRDGTPLTVDVSKRVSVRIFGQREMQALADHPELLREFVAAEGGTAWTEALAAEKGLLTSINTLDRELSTIETHLDALGDDEHELADIRDKIDNAVARGVGTHVERLSALTDAQATVTAATSWPAKVSAAVSDLSKVLPPPTVANLPAHRAAMQSALDELGQAVTAAVAGLGSAIATVESALTEPAAAWHTQHQQERAEIERQLAHAGLADPRDLGKMQARAWELRDQLAKLPETRARMGTVRGERATALQTLADVRRRKSRLVEDAATRLSSGVGHRVRVRVEPLADRNALRSTLESAVKGQSVKSDQLRTLAANHTPVALATAIRDGQAKVEALGCSAATAAKLCAVDASVARKIEETDTPDHIVIEVNLADPGGIDDAWHDVTEVSPGQRATALLALALAGGREPLIIDQPEDDLDNRYIYDEVVKVLAEVCESRQVIVATHNANIPILGDAEMVLALDAHAARGLVLASGGLENPRVAEWSRKILEGGEAAFQARHRRYQAASL